MKRLQMTFKNADSDRKSVSIANMKEDISAENVKEASKEIIETGVFTVKDKPFTRLSKAEVIETTKTILVEEQN